MPKSTLPSYTLHKPTGQARVRIRGKDHWLGKHGSPESYEQYAELIHEWQQAPKTAPPKDLTVGQLAMIYMERCRRHYRKAGEITSEVSAVKIALRHLCKLARKCPAKDFTPRQLRAVRQSMIQASYVRTSVNRHVGRIRRMFKWAAAEELIPLNSYLALGTLDGLEAGRSEAREAEPVKPVPESWIAAIEPFVSRPVWGMIQLQLATGMRPGEVRIMRGCDLNIWGEIWEYVPSSHKTEHHGKRRIVAVGPAGQAVLREFLKPDLQAFLFSPRDVRKGRAGDCYSDYSYGKAIQKGCELAFGMPAELRDVGRHVKGLKDLTDQQREKLRASLCKQAAEWRANHCWAPNRLRHNFATRARREFGIEAARVTLGHSSAVTSEIYAERDLEAARAVVAKIG
jgi:integrase